MYKVFVNDKPIYLQENIPDNADKLGTLVVRFDNIQDIQKVVSIAYNLPSVKELILFHEDVDLLWAEFKNQFQLIEAAGGLVIKSNNDLLLIFRNGKWDLPKGKVEPEESIESAAVREVEEECGLEGVSLGKSLGNTYHTYKIGDKNILKKTAWFNMTCNENCILVPQQEEGIAQVIWGKKERAQEYLQNTYPNIKSLIENHFDLSTDQP